LVLFSQKSTEIHDTINNLLIEGVEKVVISYNSAIVDMRFFTAKPFRMTTLPPRWGTLPYTGRAWWGESTALADVRFFVSGADSE